MSFEQENSSIGPAPAGVAGSFFLRRGRSPTRLGHGLERVQDVEEVLPPQITALGQDVGEVHHEVVVALELVEEVDHAELIVLGHDHEVDVAQWHQLLPVGEDLLEEVLVDHGLRRHVQLHCEEERLGGDGTYGTP